jgi:hypothetical protein
MRNLNEALQKLKELKTKGYIRTHRAGQTGIGKTLEDLLGIIENNLRISNTTFAELKSTRKGSRSMLTLFTKSPFPRNANSKLLNAFGYVTYESRGRKILHTTVKATEYNTLRGEAGFKIGITEEKLKLVSKQGEELGYWDEATLKNSFEKKLHHVLYVMADYRGGGSEEEFWFNEAWLLSGFDFGSFVNLVKDGVICIDIRIGQYPNGRTHDHGTGFRVLPDKLSLCFKQRKKVI